MNRWLMKLTQAKQQPYILVRENDFLCSQASGRDFLWTEIGRIEAYKVDCVTTDQVRWDIWMVDGTALCLTEDDSGWKPFYEAAAKVLPGFDQSAYFLVFDPPFAECRTVVYSVADQTD